MNKNSRNKMNECKNKKVFALLANCVIHCFVLCLVESL